MADQNIPEKSVFVKIDDYKEIMQTFDSTKSQLAKCRLILEKIKEMRREEEAEIELWDTSIQEIEKKLDYIDKDIREL